MKAAAYVSNARTVSLAMLTLAYFAVDLAFTNYRIAGELELAQQLFASEYASRYVANTQGKGDDWSQADVTEAGKIVVSRNKDARALLDVKVTSSSGRNWATSFNQKDLTDDALVRLKQMKQMATRIGVTKAEYEDASDNELPAVLYVAIERQLFDRDVKLQGLDIKVGPLSGMWVLSAIMIGAMIMIRTGLRAALHVEDRAIDEPWLLLDGDSFLERLVSNLWLLAILLAPWAVNLLLVLTCSNFITMRGAESGWGIMLFITLMLTGLLAAGTWSGLTLLGDVLRLRSERARCRANAVSQAS